MTKKPETNDDKEAERRFNETLGRMLGTPHKPHEPLSAEKRRMMDSLPKKGRGPKPAR